MGMNIAINVSGSDRKLTKAQQRRADKFNADAYQTMLVECKLAVIQLARRMYS